MKNQLFALIGLGLLLATASAYAQTGVVKANVPFNFIVNKTQLPAGEYRIQPVGLNATAMAIQSREPRHPDGPAERLCHRRRHKRKRSWYSTAMVPSTSWRRIWKLGRRSRAGTAPRSAREIEIAPWIIRPRVLS